MTDMLHKSIDFIEEGHCAGSKTRGTRDLGESHHGTESGWLLGLPDLPRAPSSLEGDKLGRGAFLLGAGSAECFKCSNQI